MLKQNTKTTNENNKQVIENIDVEKNKKIDELIEKIEILENKKIEKIKKYELDTKNNSFYKIVNEFLNTNENYTCLHTKNEFLKQFIKYNNSNVMFILYGSNNSITVYTVEKIENKNSVFSRYNKKLCFKTRLSFNNENKNLLIDLLKNAKKYEKTKSNDTSLTELKNELILLKNS